MRSCSCSWSTRYLAASKAFMPIICECNKEGNSQLLNSATWILD